MGCCNGRSSVATRPTGPTGPTGEEDDNGQIVVTPFTFTWSDLVDVHRGVMSVTFKHRLFWDVPTYPWVIDHLVHDFMALDDVVNAPTARQHAMVVSDIYSADRSKLLIERATSCLTAIDVLQRQLRQISLSNNCVAVSSLLNALVDIHTDVLVRINYQTAADGVNQVQWETCLAYTKRVLNVWMETMSPLMSKQPIAAAFADDFMIKRALMIAHIINVGAQHADRRVPWPCAFVVPQESNDTRLEICVIIMPSTREVVLPLVDALRTADGRIHGIQTSLSYHVNFILPMPPGAIYLPLDGGPVCHVR